MAAPTFSKVVDHEDISIVVKDGTTPTALSVALVLEDASLSISGLQQGGISQAVVPNVRRGKARSLHHGERTFVTGSLTGNMVGVDAAELHNLLLRRETYSTAVSTLGTGQKVFCVDIEVTVNESNWGGTNKVIIIEDAHFTLDFAEQDNGPATWTYNFTGYGQVLVTGSDPIQTER